ncbi:uncharacterized protein LOC130798542 [Amaranthus tricolor]|uniref:uncharacterized protein LOC130798542 n=1 Tax=Amaranthus tricolor TaxID=29722 RepID=UPI002586CEF9|nr:uncharacterized protein LOC130798542 [Amaranthus tricolor]XP_057517573.1 uncharacterized protein LOC130798542 [Amaranthus tricolor]
MMERLYKAGEKRMGTDEDMLIRIITRRGMVHLAAVKKETSGIFAFDLLTTLRCVENLAKYYAKPLEKESTLSFIVQPVQVQLAVELALLLFLAINLGFLSLWRTASCLVPVVHCCLTGDAKSLRCKSCLTLAC